MEASAARLEITKLGVVRASFQLLSGVCLRTDKMLIAELGPSVPLGSHRAIGPGVALILQPSSPLICELGDERLCAGSIWTWVIGSSISSRIR